MDTTKYPRTYHLPFSKGLTNDDRKVDSDWWEYLKGKELILTEKLDGSNTCIMKNGVYARSHVSPTTNPWDINLTERGGIYDQVKNFISDNECIYGENMYAVHSIHYSKLPAYFFMFAVRNNERWYSWDEVCEFSELLNITHVPVLERRIFESPEDLENAINNHMQHFSKFGDTIEGVVVRTADSFSIEDFSKNVVKFVRANHVQTDIHWKKTWKRHKLIFEY